MSTRETLCSPLLQQALMKTRKKQKKQKTKLKTGNTKLVPQE